MKTKTKHLIKKYVQNKPVKLKNVNKIIYKKFEMIDFNESSHKKIVHKTNLNCVR